MRMALLYFHITYDITYDGKLIEIVSKFVYLGITFTTGGSFVETH